ncbi:MAG: hypothetical protein KA257_10415 [Opitutaceae bacterium]|nr:hypothetical protein [Opitutaceae bacterium]MBP9913566.1 hypothetical protein [Opitutaceae bacterium]
MHNAASRIFFAFLAGLLAAPLPAQVLQYEITGSLQSYYSDFNFPAPTDALNTAVHSTFSIGMPFRLRFSIDPTKGVVVESTATTLRYNRDAAKQFLTAGDFLIGTEMSPVYAGTFTTGGNGSFSVQIDDAGVGEPGDQFHVELFNKTSGSYFQTQVFGADIASGARPVGVSLTLTATDPNAITALAVPTFLDGSTFTSTTNAVTFWFGNVFPSQNYVGGSVSSISITAAAIPEPATSAAISGAVVFLAFGIRRWRKGGSGPSV